MKRLKSLLPLVVAMVLTVSIMIGSFGVFAFAATNLPTNGKEFFDNAENTNIVTRVKEGEDFDIPVPLSGVTAEVRNPVGIKIDPINKTTTPYKFIAAQLGNYTVTYSAEDGKYSYSYNVLSYEDREYFMYVKETAEDFIPTYVQKGAVIKLPEYQLAYKNSKGEIVSVQDSKADATDNDKVINVTVSDEYATLNADNTITTKKSGTLDITFWGKTGKDTTKKFTKEYTVQVQDVFKNTIPPVLNSVSVATTANKNALFTLPVATATDSYESKVFVDVKVTDPDGKPVLDYTNNVNDYGYAERPTDESGLKAVVFDNNEVKSFYPVKDGPYKIQYTAITGSADNRQTSIVHEHIVECRDRLAPQIVEIASDKIPTKWGLENVYFGKYTTPDAKPTAESRASTVFDLPFPTITDNADDNTKLTLVITVVNPANRTLVRWEGLVSDYLADGIDLYSPSIHNEFLKTAHKDKKFVLSGNETTGKYMPFSFEIFDFENSKIKADTEKFGDWTIKYSVKDSSGNGATTGNSVKSFKVNLSKNYTNLEKPAINEDALKNNIPKYILINDDNNTFTVPVIPMKSSDDLDLSFAYTMKSGATLPTEPVKYNGISYTPVNTFDIKRESNTSAIGGKEYSVQKIGNNHFVLISENNKDTAFMLSPTVEFTFVATDDVGNSFGFADCTKVDVDGDKIAITLIYEGFDTNTNGFKVDFAKFFTAPVTEMQGEEINAGGFEITDIKYIDYTGFEISVLDADGEPVTINAVTYNREIATDKHSIFVDDVRFTPKKAATDDEYYNLNVRVFDILGKSEVFSFAFQVEENPNYVGTTAAKIESTGQLRTEYELEKTYTVKNENHENVIVRKIDNCLSFSIMNNVFVGLDSGTYRIHDYVVEGYANFDAFLTATINHATTPVTWDVALKNFHRQTYSVTVSNNEKPVIEIHDVFPRFIENKTVTIDLDKYVKGEFIELPVITGYTKHENAEVEVEVTFGGAVVEGGVKKIYIKDLTKSHDEESNRTFESEDEDGKPYTFSGIFAFAATADGDYTVRITVSTSSGDETVTYTIKVGDRTPVSFTVEPVSTAKVNQKFKMTKPTIDGEFSTLTIELKDPNGNKVSDAGLSISYDNFSNFADYEQSSYAFTDAGTYTIIYTVQNKNDETIKSTQTFKLDVSAKGGSVGRPPVALTAVLIIVGVLLIAGVVVYVVRFRAVKK